jgi:hypothetical protein
MNHIDESTFLQLTEAVKAHREIINSLIARSGQVLSYQDMHTIRHGTDLENVARSQARLAGIVPPAPPGAKS